AAHPPPAHYPRSLHDALPISGDKSNTLRIGVEDRLYKTHTDSRYSNLEQDSERALVGQRHRHPRTEHTRLHSGAQSTQLFDDLVDRKSTRLNSSHVKISYAVF